MSKDYIVPAKTRIGHVHLKVSDLKRSLTFYCDLLGFELIVEPDELVVVGEVHAHQGRPDRQNEQTGEECD